MNTFKDSHSCEYHISAPSSPIRIYSSHVLFTSYGSDKLLKVIWRCLYTQFE